MIADLRLLSVAVFGLCVRSISQSSPFGTLIQVKLSRCPIFVSISQRNRFETFDFSKALQNPKAKSHKSNYDRYSLLHCLFALSYAMLPIPCSLYFVSLNSFPTSHLARNIASTHSPSQNARNRPTHPNLSMQIHSEKCPLEILTDPFEPYAPKPFP